MSIIYGNMYIGKMKVDKTKDLKKSNKEHLRLYRKSPDINYYDKKKGLEPLIKGEYHERVIAIQNKLGGVLSKKDRKKVYKYFENAYYKK